MAKMLVMSLLPMLSAFQVREQETEQVAQNDLDFDGMKESLQLLASNAAKTGKIDQGTIVAVNSFLDTIRVDLLAALEEDRRHSQSIYDSAVAAVHQCDTDRNEWFEPTSSHFDLWNMNVTFAGADHDNCRSQENVTYHNYTSYCKTMHDRVCDWNVCTLPDGGFAGGDTDEVDVYMNCVCDFFETHRDEYYDERNNCQESHNLHDVQVAACDVDQRTFEDEYCDRETQVQVRCYGYNECRFNTETTYLADKVEIEDLEQIFQTQFVALQHLLCYGEQILNNSTDLTSCDAVGNDCQGDYPDDCPVISYAPLDPFIDCTQPTIGTYPCTALFHTNFYGQYDDTFTPTNDCHVCSDAAVTADDVNGGAGGGGRKTDPNSK